jgi:outer membrane protein assembly factor BamB
VVRFLLIACALIACGKEKHEPERAPVAKPAGTADTGSVSAGSGAGSAAPAAPSADAECEPLPFAESSMIPEASGAAWLTIEGKPTLVVISDSGNDGAYALLDPDTGKTLEQGKFPLGAAGPDIEGLATRGDRVFGITSSGWLRAWERKGQGFALVVGPDPIGAVDLPDKKGPPTGTGMVCGPKKSNCGRDYEGLCLVEPAQQKGPCVGFVASRADGHLYCLVDQNGAYVAKYEQRIHVGKPGAIADCAFADDGTLWVGANMFGLSQVYRIDGWDRPTTAKVVPFAKIGVGFAEVLAVRGDVFYRMSDTGGAPSLLAKFRCKRQ